MAGPVLWWSLEYMKVGSKPLSLFLNFSPISLLIIWNVIKCTLFMLTSYSSQVHPSFPCTLHPKEKKKKTTKFTMCCPYIHWNMGKFPSAQHLKDNWAMSLPTPRSHQLWSYTWAFLSQCWRRLVTSCLDCHRSLQCLILNSESVVTDLTAKYASLLMTATSGSDGGSSMHLNMVPGSSGDHGHQHGL